MYIKKAFSFLFILTVIILSFPGCTNIQESANAQTDIVSTIESNSPAIATSSVPLMPIEFEAFFPNGAPPLNQTAEFWTLDNSLNTKDNFNLNKD